MTQLEQIYKIASDLATSKRAIDIKRAMDLFESIPAYKDASSCAQACKERLDKLSQYYGEDRKQLGKKPLLAVLSIAVCILVLCVVCGVIAFVDSEEPDHNEMINLVAPTYVPTGTEAPTFGVTTVPTWTSSPAPTTISSATISPTRTNTSVPTATPTRTTASAPTPTPTSTSASTPLQYEPLSPAVSVGALVQYGTYEQDNILSNGAEAIEWIVIDKQGDKALLLARCGLDAKPFNEKYADVTWVTCTLRTWLNDTFYNQAFTATEKQKVQTTTITETLSPYYDYWDEIEPTTDRLFVLSYNEYVHYDAIVDITKTITTPYAEAQGASCTSNGEESSPGWWLRTPYEREGEMMLIDYGGCEEDRGLVHTDYYTVRPAMWVQLDASLTPTTTPTITTKPAFSTATIPSDLSVGDQIKFGVYEQDGNFTNGKEEIEWLVLDKQGDKALLISLYGLDRQPFNPTNQERGHKWETCSLRQWLNTTFYGAAFSDVQQRYITPTTLQNLANPNTLNGVDDPDTVDYIFLLSVQEAEQYLDQNVDDRLLNMPITTYTKSLGSAWENSDMYSHRFWWLRTPASSTWDSVSAVENKVRIYNSGMMAIDNNVIVRPAMWVTLSN